MLFVSCVSRLFGRDVGCRVVEGGACVAYGDAHEVDAAPIFLKGVEKGMVLLGLLCELILTMDVPPKADFEEDEGAIPCGQRSRGPGWGRLTLFGRR
jgi:hypothetical protein